MSESTSWRFKKLKMSSVGWEIFYSKGDSASYSIEISESDLSQAIALANGTVVDENDTGLLELRKLGCIQLDDRGRIPAVARLTGLGRHLVIWMNNQKSQI